MSLIEKVKADQLAARKAHNTFLAALLTTLLGEVGTVAKNANRELATDEEVVTVTKKLLKSVEENIKLVGENKLFLDEKAALEVYLPKQMTEEQLTDFFVTHKPANKGAAMKLLKEKFPGQYDGKLAATIFDKWAT